MRDQPPPVPETSRTEPSDEEPTSHHASGGALLKETVVILVSALVLSLIIKTFLFQAFYIPSASMRETLVQGDRVLVTKLAPGPLDVHRGDVVVFKDPGGWLNAAESAGPTGTIPQVMAKIGLYPSGGHLVKRVIGVPGDVIECCDEQGRILVNGQPLEEEAYVQHSAGTKCNGPMVNQCSTDWTAGPVPEGHIFVMGDNRAHSADSTVHMCKPKAETDCVSGQEFVPEDLVVGRVFVLLWPRERFDWVSRPSTFEDVPDAS